ncbi:hypothetical protein ES706_05767 [subsurface metagenome]
MPKSSKTAGLGTIVALAFLLIILSASSASAKVGIGIASHPLDNLVVIPRQEFVVGVRVYNTGDNAFVAHLEATGGLPVTFAKNDFELGGGHHSKLGQRSESLASGKLGRFMKGIYRWWL